MKVSRAAVATVAACLTVGLAGAPSAMADTAEANAAASTPSTKTINKRLNTARKQLKSTRRSVSTANRRIRKVTVDLGAVAKRLQTAEGGVNLLLGAAPQLITAVQKLGAEVPPALTALKTGLEAAGAGLVALKTGTEAGFARVGTALKSTEYGFGQVVLVTGADTPPIAQPGSFVVTPDIPDAVQQAQTTQEFVKDGPGAAPVAVLYGVRSAESDGTGATLPAAHCRVTVTNQAGDQATTAPNPAFGGQPFQPVAEKSAQTSTTPANAGFPFGLKTSGADADKFNTFVAATVPIGDGETFRVGLSCVDISASADDPSA